MKSRNLTEDSFKELYYSKELSRKDIAEALGFSEAQVKYWRRKFNLSPRTFRRLFRYKLTFEPSPYLAYVLGVILGDGFITRQKKKRGTHYIIKLRVTDRNFAESFCHALKSLGMNARITHNPSEPHVHIVLAYCKAFYEWFSKLSLIDIEGIALKYPVDFIRGFYESEGWVTKRIYLDKRKPQSKFHIQRALGMCNYKREVLEIVQRVFSKLGYNSYLHQRRDRPKEHDLMIFKKHEIQSLLQILNPCIKRVKYGS